MMKEYLLCTEIKEEHLNDLRLQYAADTYIIKDLLRSLSESNSMSEEVLTMIKKLKEHFASVENNYKYGNYFFW